MDRNRLKKYFWSQVSTKHKRMRSRLVKVLDTYFFEELTTAQMKKLEDKIVTVVDDIHDYDAISDFISYQHTQHIPTRSLQYRLYVVPDYSEDESVVILKMHHVLGDGLAVVVLLGIWQEYYDPEQFVQTGNVNSCLKDFCLFLLKPFSIMYAAYFFLVWGTDRNFIKGENIELTGLKKNSICKPFDITALK